MYVIRFLAPAGVVSKEFAELADSHVGRLFVSYDHSETDPVKVLVSTDDPGAAMQFDHQAEAFAEWRRSYGLRPDGKPDRPLTFYTVEILSVDDL